MVERDAPRYEPVTISGTEWCVMSSAIIGVAFRVLAPVSLYWRERAGAQAWFNYLVSKQESLSVGSSDPLGVN